jgi:hypothetical protein
LLIAEVPTLAGAVNDSIIWVALGVMESMAGIPGAKASEDVITRFDEPVDATATNNPLP